MARALVLVLDSVGIGAAPDAAHYGDEGADTIGHIADLCARGQADRASLRAGPLRLPNLVELGLGEACRLATGHVPPGLQSDTHPIGRYGCAAEISKGKDTPSGHWELAGVPVLFDWGYFPREVPCFAPKLISALCQQADLPGILGNCHASGTEIIAELGDKHIRSGKPICYTSADSVFQIAAHEDAFGLERLYELCTVARRLVDPLRIGRVIARPFTGSSAEGFVRTGNRRDYSVPPPSPTVLDRATQAGRCVLSVGKIGDIFAHSGTGRVLKANGNAALFDRTLEGIAALPDGGLLFANFIDFDSLYGHRRDPAGYAAALEAFDARIPEIRRMLREDDLLVITADHGCDPTWRGTDHTREQVPVLLFGPSLVAGPIGRRETFADVAAAVDEHLALASASAGARRDMLHSRAPAF
ncbi:phosphopentomutase [Bradyrhizobium sp. 157]|uniref:phosphopentomutase n=1 Tax=Bradyrhizobium sp. 157 TaxID=2782631 RepID=UPI001FFB548E|nr:phosphopentomutase [Bradyrhizobium sp. 157]MCK1636098.1 phosphopentomutase [Bradyrhizobium sp. 157]